MPQREDSADAAVEGFPALPPHWEVQQYVKLQHHVQPWCTPGESLIRVMEKLFGGSTHGHRSAHRYTRTRVERAWDVVLSDPNMVS